MQILAGREDYFGATIETEALSLAAGAWLAGKKTAVFCQNSGLGNLVSPLSSLNAPFEIPSLLVIGWRGKPGTKDEPQHTMMGETTPAILRLMGVNCHELPSDQATAHNMVSEAFNHIENTGESVALLVSNGTFEPLQSVSGQSASECDNNPSNTIHSDSRLNGPLPSRIDALRSIVAHIPAQAAVIATTGKSGRELYAINDKDQNFYMVGSMGSASSIGLGIALNTERPVIVLDGDGAALMRLGTMATVGRTHAPNMVHVIMDNQVHDSTGGQPTGARHVNFPAVAAACRYQSATSCDDTTGLAAALITALEKPGPHLVHVRIKPGSLSGLARPAIAPRDVARRFRAFLRNG